MKWCSNPCWIKAKLFSSNIEKSDIKVINPATVILFSDSLDKGKLGINNYGLRQQTDSFSNSLPNKFIQVGSVSIIANGRNSEVSNCMVGHMEDISLWFDEISSSFLRVHDSIIETQLELINGNHDYISYSVMISFPSLSVGAAAKAYRCSLTKVISDKR